MMSDNTYRQLLEARLEVFDTASFLASDPLGIVYELKDRCCGDADRSLQIETGALWIAMISWGGRKMIRRNACRLLDRCAWQPYTWLMSGEYGEIDDRECIHRTLFGKGFKAVCSNMEAVYRNYPSLEDYVRSGCPASVSDSRFRYVENLSLVVEPARLGSVSKNSACKRLCMFMRWMVRSGVPDLGIWKNISPSELFAVMDVHVSRQACGQGLLCSKGITWKNAVDLTGIYLQWDPDDPLKYDTVMMYSDL